MKRIKSGTILLTLITLNLLLFSAAAQDRPGRRGPGSMRGRDFEMTAERFERFKSNPERYEWLKQRTPPERFAQWEAGDFLSGASPAAAAEAAAQAENDAAAPKTDEQGNPIGEEKEKEGGLYLEDMTNEERAAALRLLYSGNVPDFSELEGKHSIDSENKFYANVINRRDEVLNSNAPILLRKYTKYILNKYDKDGDNKLSQEEWASIPGAQAMDLNGDLVLTEDEILYYLVRFSANRTIYNPYPPQQKQGPAAIVINQEVPKIHPLSGELKTKTPEEAESEMSEENDLADISEDDFKNMMEDSDIELENVDDPELLDVLLQETPDSTVREYAVPRQRLLGMPAWFILRDLNGDGQLTLREFAPTLSLEGIAFFGKMDADHDGYLVPDEVRAYMTRSQNTQTSQPPQNQN